MTFSVSFWFQAETLASKNQRRIFVSGNCIELGNNKNRKELTFSHTKGNNGNFYHVWNYESNNQLKEISVPMVQNNFNLVLPNGNSLSVQLIQESQGIPNRSNSDGINFETVPSSSHYIIILRDNTLPEIYPIARLLLDINVATDSHDEICFIANSRNQIGEDFSMITLVETTEFCPQHYPNVATNPPCGNCLKRRTALVPLTVILNDEPKNFDLEEIICKLIFSNQQNDVILKWSLDFLPDCLLIPQFCFEINIQDMDFPVINPRPTLSTERIQIFTRLKLSLSAIGDLREEFKNSEAMQQYASFLLPTLEPDGRYQNPEHDNPQQRHDIWGGDLQDEHFGLALADESPRSSVTYCLLRMRISGSVLGQRWKVMGRLRDKYHWRQQAVFSQVLDQQAQSFADDRMQMLQGIGKQNHQLYISVLQELAVLFSQQNLQPELSPDDLTFLLRHSSAIVRGRIEALLVSDRFTQNHYRNHMEAAEAWFAFVVALWSRKVAEQQTNNFRDSITEVENGDFSIPRFYYWDP